MCAVSQARREVKIKQSDTARVPRMSVLQNGATEGAVSRSSSPKQRYFGIFEILHIGE